ncbi:MAG: ankyrin repeat domain-containing protein [Betaproteobacteria bacterium]|nr:ankyrin repeat domain-containing protein [Betaproteobacteria bacterium]MDH5222828.1 ankyrin repeat domain-containing protein [Betaproteobacteria bacterium]
MIQRSVEKDDLLTRLRIREVALFSLIALTAVLANLPEDYIDELGLNRDYLLAGLGSSVVIGLFLYLRFFFFFSVVLLFLGANLPDQIAQGFGISKIPLILALVAMVGISLINYVVKLLPTGLEPKPKEKSPEGVRAMFYAVEKNNVPYAQRVMSMNFDPNLHHDNGYTPLAYAALRGNLQMVEVLLRHGADPALPTREGETAVELALRAGHKDIADLLKRARQEREARGASAPAAGAAIAR